MCVFFSICKCVRGNVRVCFHEFIISFTRIFFWTKRELLWLA